MIKEITLEWRYFSPMHLEIREKERYTLSEDGTMTYGSYVEGNMTEPKNSEIMMVSESEKNEIFRITDELAWINEACESYIDDCHGDVRVCYDDGREVVQPRGSRLYDHLTTVFEKRFDS